MRCPRWLLLVALGGCNQVFGLDQPADDDEVAVDAPVDGDLFDGDLTDGDMRDADIDGRDPGDGGAGQIVDIVAGGNHTCARHSEGKVACWGSGVFGQLGHGNTSTIGDNEPASAGGNIDVGAVVIGIVAGSDHTCALADDGDVYCWGGASRGQLGHGNVFNVGDDEPPSAAGPVPVGATSQRVAAGAQHTCAVSQNQTLRCWGAGSDGRLGYGNVNDLGDNELPASVGNVPVPGSVVAVTAGTAHTCALRNDGTVVCWGSGVGGRLGYGNSNSIGDNEQPVLAVDVGEPVVQIGAGGEHTCALTTSGSVRCWGLNQFGQLGYSNTTSVGDNETPSSVGSIDLGGAATQIAVGGQHTCALLNNGAVRCWGRNDHGQLGYGNTNNIGDNETPAIAGDVALGGLALAVTAGALHTCALFQGGRLLCWGSAVNGQLGYGTLEDIGDNETPASAGSVPID